jgi:hypothetical protein
MKLQGRKIKRITNYELRIRMAKGKRMGRMEERGIKILGVLDGKDNYWEGGDR